MAAVSRVYAARLAGMVVLGPDGESIGRVLAARTSKGDVAERRAKQVPKRADPVAPT